MAGEQSTVVYFEVEGIPGAYFTCQRYGTMSKDACARNYQEAPKAAQSGRLGACIGCRIGKGHVSPDPADNKSCSSIPTHQSQVCLRCRRGGRDVTSRLLGRMRLVRGQTICISCYNREREVRQGRNAKGAQPKKWAGLFCAQVSYVKQGQVFLHQSMAVPVIDRIEAALVTMRQTQADGVFFTAPGIVRLS